MHCRLVLTEKEIETDTLGEEQYWPCSGFATAPKDFA
jgi:hypothetical protein